MPFYEKSNFRNADGMAPNNNLTRVYVSCLPIISSWEFTYNTDVSSVMSFFFSLSENGFTDSQLTMHYNRLPNKIVMWMIILYKDSVNYIP